MYCSSHLNKKQDKRIISAIPQFLNKRTHPPFRLKRILINKPLRLRLPFILLLREAEPKIASPSPRVDFLIRALDTAHRDIFQTVVADFEEIVHFVYFVDLLDFY